MQNKTTHLSVILATRRNIRCTVLIFVCLLVFTIAGLRLKFYHSNSDKIDNSKVTFPSKISYVILAYDLYPQLLQQTNNSGILYEQMPWVSPLQRCTYQNCRVTNNNTLVSEADAVVYNVWRIPMFQPHPFFTQNHCQTLRERRLSIFYTWEQPRKVWKFWWTIFNNCFHKTSTYSFISDIPTLYGYSWKTNLPISVKNEKAVNDHKTKDAAWVVTNCFTQNRRESYVKELQQFINVDIFGGCNYNKCPGNDDECFQFLEKHYKFYLAFENNNCLDYITEKTFRSLHYNLIPVVMGGANYSYLLPPHSFIDSADFPTAHDLAVYLALVSRDQNLYEYYFEWKQQYSVLDPKKSVFNFCEVCRILNQQKSPFPVLQNISEIWNADRLCLDPVNKYDWARASQIYL